VTVYRFFGNSGEFFIDKTVFTCLTTPIDSPRNQQYGNLMDITSLSTALSQNKVQEAASVQAQKLAMNSAETQGAAIVKMMSQPITDPALGNHIDFLA
jgi:hypothetical protein